MLIVSVFHEREKIKNNKNGKTVLQMGNCTSKKITMKLQTVAEQPVNTASTERDERYIWENIK